jgi:hypothetical protein
MVLSDGKSIYILKVSSEERQRWLSDTFIQLADGKLNGQKAFMTGALKVKGNVMLAVGLSSNSRPDKSHDYVYICEWSW